MNKIFVLILFLVIGTKTISAQRVETLVKGPSTFDDGLAIDSSGNIYASRYYGSTITKISPTGETEIFARGFASPNAIAFDNEGNLIVPNATGSRVDKVTPDGTKTTILNGVENPTGIAVDKDGNIFVSHYSINRITKIDTTGRTGNYLSGGELNGPVSMAFDEEGQLFIGNFNDGKIFKYSEESGLTVIADIPGWLGTFTLTDSTIYATAFQRNQIYKIAKDGSSQSIFAGTEAKGSKDGMVDEATFDGPNGIVASITGDTLYISDFETRSMRMITGVIPNNPKLSTPDTLDFGQVNLDEDKLHELKLCLVNDGNDTLRIDSLNFSDPAFSGSISVGAIPAYSTDSITVAFNPSHNTIGEQIATLTIQTNTKETLTFVVLKATTFTNTAIQQTDDIPSEFELHQNYPNPFNPSTAISYALSAGNHVNLKVFDALGREVATLISGSQSAGIHSVNFDASGLSSGVYVYRMEAGNFVQTKKMLLIK